MNNLDVVSVVERIAENLDVVLKQIPMEKKIAIYGMDNYSFAVQSLLKNRKRAAEMYVSADKLAVMEGKRRLSGLSARYLKKNDDLVEIIHFNDLDLHDIYLLSASELSSTEKAYLYEKGFINNVNYSSLYDWENDDFTEYVKDKREITSTELQMLEKNILKDFDQYCRDNKLRYWVCGGTLLGTLRHKGFIPWDDDIDVFMPWSDYRKFVMSYQDNGLYRVACMDKAEYMGRYKTIWGKMVENTTIIREKDTVMYEIHPAWIDIFPIIGMPSEKLERDKILKEVIEIERQFSENFYRNDGNVGKRNQAYASIIEISERYDFDCTEYVGVIGTQYREKDIMTRKVFDETIRMPFEDIEVNVPGGYKEYLNNLYGLDWIEIPDASKRRSHKLEAYWI